MIVRKFTALVHDCKKVYCAGVTVKLADAGVLGLHGGYSKNVLYYTSTAGSVLKCTTHKRTTSDWPMLLQTW